MRCRQNWHKIKRIRAQGGCQGTDCRRRTWQAAKSLGEPQAGIDPRISEWGNPAGVMPGHRGMNKIVPTEGTRGTETSKYPEEKKENSISRVVASEKERGQTGGLRTSGVEGERDRTRADLKPLESGSKEGDRPVGEGEDR